MTAPSGSGLDSVSKTTWPWFEQMSFLNCNAGQFSQATESLEPNQNEGKDDEVLVEVTLEGLENQTIIIKESLPPILPDLPPIDQNEQVEVVNDGEAGGHESAKKKVSGTSDGGFGIRKRMRYESGEAIKRAAKALESSSNQVYNIDINCLFSYLVKVPLLTTNKFTLHIKIISSGLLKRGTK